MSDNRYLDGCGASMDTSDGATCENKNSRNGPQQFETDEARLMTAPSDLRQTSAAAFIDVPITSSLVDRSVTRDGDWFILVFADGRQVFGQCCRHVRGKIQPVKINKKTYSTAHLIGLPYGTVLEQGPSRLVPLPVGEDLLPDFEPLLTNAGASLPEKGDTTPPPEAAIVHPPSVSGTMATTTPRDNRHLIDNNTSQSLNQNDLMKMRREGLHGHELVSKLVQSSATFELKTVYSKAKYVARKQMKHQPRCRMLRCTASTICEALFMRDARKIMNVRTDTLGQILSYANLRAGGQALVMETCLGLITGAVAERMGGYGKVLSIYSGQQPSFNEMLQRFNLSFAENQTIKWIHSGDIFHGEDKDCTTTASLDRASASHHDGSTTRSAIDGEPRQGVEVEEKDLEREERDLLVWPCPLQDHTRRYLCSMKTRKEQMDFLVKRAARFSRKLTRHTTMEALDWLQSRQCDCIILAARYDPTCTLLGLLPHLAPSSPFVVYSEFIEPLTDCFRQLQDQGLAINLRLSHTWMREWQVLPERTHPMMNMSQSGGFILTGIKLDPATTLRKFDDELLKEIRLQHGGRRGKRPKAKVSSSDHESQKHNANNSDGNATKLAKRKRIE